VMGPVNAAQKIIMQKKKDLKFEESFSFINIKKDAIGIIKPRLVEFNQTSPVEHEKIIKNIRIIFLKKVSQYFDVVKAIIAIGIKRIIKPKSV